jgi:protease I
MKPILIVIAPKEFRDEELFETKDELEKSGQKTVIASTIIGTCFGSKGGYATSEILIDDIESKNYDGVVFIGGAGSRLFFNNEHALRIAKEMNSQKKLVGAICIAPVILAKAGILKNKKATVFHSEIDTIKQLGTLYSEMDVTRDENIITGNGPAVSRIFAKALADELSAHFQE